MRRRSCTVCLFAMLILCLLFGLPAVKASRAPEPFILLDIGAPRDGVSAEKYREEEVDCLTHPHGSITEAWNIAPKIHKLKCLPEKLPLHWIAKRVVVKQYGNDNCLRITFRGGARDEKVIILNALLRGYIRIAKTQPLELKERVRQLQVREMEINLGLRIAPDPELARLRQIRVRQWAK